VGVGQVRHRPAGHENEPLYNSKEIEPVVCVGFFFFLLTGVVYSLFVLPTTMSDDVDKTAIQQQRKLLPIYKGDYFKVCPLLYSFVFIFK
jgi:hypothetical protein